MEAKPRKQELETRDEDAEEAGGGVEEKIKRKTNEIFKKGNNLEQVLEGYDEWSENYEEIIQEGRYNSPAITLKQVLQYFPPSCRASVRVLDVAAGTGKVGRDLWEAGFRHIDGVEPSSGMMEKLKQSNAYTNTYLEAVGTGRCTVDNDTYDLVLVSGGMGEGHIPVKGLNDLISPAKKGGMIIIVMRESFLEIVEAYKDKLEPYMEELEREGVWSKVARDVVPNYYFENNGVVFVYRKV